MSDSGREGGPGDRPAGLAGGDSLLARLSRAVALAGGFLLIGVMAMTVVSVIGRYMFNAPIPGDYEITELVCGIAVFAFFPYCHVRRGNIVVEFFASGFRERTRHRLDTVHNLVFALVAGLITWRLFIGGVDKLHDGETTLFLGIPIHLGYFPAFIGAILLTLVCIRVFLDSLRVPRQ